MKGIMKKTSVRENSRLSCMAALLLASVLWPAACRGATEIINSNTPSPLEIAVKDSGTPGVWVNQPNGRTYQYFGQYSWGTIIWLNGTNANGRYTTGYYGSPTTNSPVSNTKTGSGTTNDPYVISTLVKLGTNDVYMNQRFSYIDGDRFFTKNWTLTNSGATTFTDLRFFHGGDAFFGGTDAARSWWDETNQKIYLNNNNFTNCGYMAFYPNLTTPAARYYGGQFGYGNWQAATLAQLSNTTDSAYVDAGYYLQWNKTSLAPGQTWTIEAYEYWSLPGSLAVLPPANEYVETNSTVAAVFKIHNLSTNAESSIGLAANGGDWTVSLPDGTNIALAALSISNVNVNVVIPAGAADGTTRDIVLTAISGTSTGTGSSRLTVYVPTFTITPNPLDFGSVTTGATSELNITLSNSASSSPLTIGTISDTLDAPFSIVADNASGQTVAPGETCYVTVGFTPTSLVSSADSFTWPIVSPVMLSRTVEVQGTGTAQGSGWLTINVTPDTGSWNLTTPAGYTGPTSGTGSLSAVSAPAGAYSIAWGTLSGYYAPNNQTQSVTAGNTTTFTGVYTAAPSGNGSLAVVILPADAVAAGAMWRVDAGEWRVSGTIVTGLTAGTHTVSFYEVAGYTSPANQNVTISSNQLAAVQGTYRLLSGDAAYKPISADYDGDQLADPAICQPASGLWLARFSGIGYQWGRMTRVFGPGGYAPVAADFDGDAKADPGLYNTTNGEWRAMFSNVGYTECFVANLLGDAGSTALAADFDGDAKADPAIYTPATGDWKAKLSSGGYLTFTADNLLGHTGFAASAGDIDGDRLADPFVCDMATGQCMALLSSIGYYRVETTEGFLGAPEWLLALADYEGDGLADPAIYDPSTGTLAVRVSGAGYTLFIVPEFMKP